MRRARLCRRAAAPVRITSLVQLLHLSRTGLRRRAPAPGFTLIELLVAISILALVAVLGWRGLDGIVRARVALTAQMEQTRGLQLAFAQMQSDGEHLAGAALLARQPNLLAENGRLTLVRTVFADNEPTRLQVASYRITDGVLTRRESNGTRDLALLDAMWQAALSDTDTSTAVALQAGVAGMAVRIWDGAAWQPTGAAAASLLAKPATGLEVALQLQGQDTSLTKVFLLGAL